MAAKSGTSSILRASLQVMMALIALSSTAFAQERRATVGLDNTRALFGTKDFPIAVWLQDPQNAARYRQAGISLYIGLWQGPTEAQLAALRAAHMPVICAQNAVGLTHRSDPTIVGWMHQDEPDNAQPVTDPKTGKTSYGPCVPPAKIIAEYNRLRAADPTRPILLNLGQGVADDAWIGRGSGASLNDYPAYARGSDIASFDIYPVAGLGPDGVNKLWFVPKGVDRLIGWTANQKPVWTCIECTHIGDAKAQATPSQVRAEVWMALIHGARGLVYFVHQFQPQFDEHALLDDPPMLAAVTAINRQVHDLAPVLNSPSLSHVADVRSSSEQCPIDIMVKRRDRTTYLFAVGTRNVAGRGSFTVRGLPPIATAEALGEGRTISVRGGQFSDAFTPYGVHLYRIR